MILKRIYFICLLIGTLILFVLSAFSMYELPDNPSITYNFQIINYSFFIILLFLSNVMYFKLGKTIYLLISVVIFLLFLDFYWIIIQVAYIRGAFFSTVAIFLVTLNYYVLKNYFKPVKVKSK